ncbi:11168_t:CDS:2 [Paraglomus brasilianum]|uniref:11168_t:CDS:1 n=1 Tax=Paraglomus brasilianum TaxID=144538 RepID=A0A9N8VL44_9GLOM|nr:11168_t:CDS:2 [Paraglomus brasilianum]
MSPIPKEWLRKGGPFKKNQLGGIQCRPYWAMEPLRTLSDRKLSGHKQNKSKINDWLRKFDAEMRKANRPMLLDNAPVHKFNPDSKLTNITIRFFASNMASVIQPCDASFKAQYRKPFIQQRINLTKMVQSLSLLQAEHQRECSTISTEALTDEEITAQAMGLQCAVESDSEGEFSIKEDEGRRNRSKSGIVIFGTAGR